MSKSTEGSDREQRLNEVLAAWYAAAEAGQAVERHVLVARHPDLASDLNSFFAAKEEIERTAGWLLPGQAPAAAAVGPGFRPCQVGDYEIEQEIARGGMGVVYRARQRSLNRVVALKMILTGPLASPGDRQRFRREAEAAATLDHPHIVPIYEVGEHEGQPYFAMKLIEAGNLAQHLASRAFDPLSSARLMAQVARAVHHAHQRGILHRDLKPANVLLDVARQPHVSDFGLAKWAECSGALTTSGVILGTPSYMAPEQARGQKDLTTAADVWSLGAILYELLTGQPPFRGETALATLRQLQDEEPRRPQVLEPRLPADLETICLKCLRKGPDCRYGSAEALAEDLERFLAGEPIQARPVTLLERGVKWVKRRPALASLLLLVVLLTVGGVAGIVGQWWAAEKARQDADARADGERTARLQEQAAREEARLAQEREKTARQKEASFRRQAEEERDAKELALVRAEGHRLVTEAAAVRDRNIGLSFLLAIEAAWRAPNPLTFRALHGALEVLHEKKLLDTESGSANLGSLRFSPDGRLLLKQDNLGRMKVLELATGKELFRRDCYNDHFGSLRFSPDSKRIVSTGEGWAHQSHGDGKTYLYTDRVAHVWDARTGKEVLRLRRHQSRIVSAEYTSDGKRIVTGSYDGSAMVWDAETGKRLMVLKKQARSLTAAIPSPDGKQVLTIYDDSNTRTDYPDNRFPDADTIDPEVLAEVKSGGLGGASSGGEPGAVVADGAVAHLWDVETGKVIAALKRRTGGGLFNTEPRPSGFAFSPDGKQVLAVARGAVLIWGLPAGETEQRVLRDHGDSVNDACWSPNGKSILTCGGDRTACIRDAATGQELLRLKGHQGAVRSARFSPDGKQVVTTSSDATVRVWDGTTGAELPVLRGQEFPFDFASFAPDGQTVLTTDAAHGLRLWSVKAPAGLARVIGEPVPTSDEKDAPFFGEMPFRIPLDMTPMLRLTPDRSRLVTRRAGEGVRVWDTDTGKEVQRLDPPRLDWFRSAHLSEDGQHLVTTSSSMGREAVQVWDLKTGKPRGPALDHRTGAVFARLTSDGKRLITVGDGLEQNRPGSLLVALFSTGVTESKEIPRGTVRIWDAATGKLLATAARQIQAEEPRHHRSTSPLIEEYRSGRSNQFNEVDLACSADGKRLLGLVPEDPSGGQRSGDRTISAALLDGMTGKEIAVLRPPGPVLASSFSPDGRRILTTSRDRTVRLWDAQDGRLLGILQGFGDIPTAAWSEDGRRLVVVEGKRAHLYDAETRALRMSFVGHEERALSAVLSADGKLLATASIDRSAAVWDVGSGQMLALYPHPATVVQVAFLAGGKCLASTCSDGLVRIWPNDIWPAVLARRPRVLTWQERQRYNVTPWRDKPTPIEKFQPDPSLVAVPPAGEEVPLAPPTQEGPVEARQEK
jgi:WD40 repeat protein